MPFRALLRHLTPVAAIALFAVPAAAQSPFDKIEITTAQLADGVYMLQGAGGNIGVSVGDDGVILIDDQFAPLTAKIRAALAQLSDKPVRFVLNTHWHGDHTGGNENFAKLGAWIVAQDNVRTRMSEEQASQLLDRTTPPSPADALPVITFSDNMDFYLNDQHIHIFHVEHAHTDGDVIVHVVDRNVIHMGDCFWNGIYPLIDVDAGGSLHGMIQAAEAGLELADGSTKIIPGHGPLGNREDLRAFRDMLAEVERRIRPMVVAGQSEAEIVRAKPLADLDAKWGKGYMTPERFLHEIVYDLSR